MEEKSSRKSLILILLALLLLALASALLYFLLRGGAGEGEAPEPGLPFEETLAPYLAEEVSQVDYALAQAMGRLGLPLENIKVDADFLLKREDGGQLYHAKFIRLYAGEDVPGFLRALRDSLLAWAEKAVLAEGPADPDLLAAASGNGSVHLWDIFIDGVKTHSLIIIGRSALPPETRPEEPEVAPPPQPPKSRQPLLVVVMDDLGESKNQAQALIGLDYPVTFAIWPRSSQARSVAVAAHAAGREVIVHQPMEPVGYPQVNPGPGVLLRGMPTERMLEILERNIALVPHASGVNNHMGSALTQNEEAMRALSANLARRGFIALDSLTHARSCFSRVAASSGARALRRDVFLDVVAEKGAVLAQLRRAERIALARGQAIAIGHPYPATLAALKDWQKLRNPGVRMARLEDLQFIRIR